MAARPAFETKHYSNPQWPRLVLDVAASKIDRDATTRRLRKLIKLLRKR